MKRSQRKQPPSRSQLRESKQFEIGGHIPSFAVRQPVIMDDKQAAEIHKSLHRGLKQEFPRKMVKNFDVIPPQEWSVAILEKSKFEDTLRKSPRKPTQLEMTQLAAELGSRLRDSIVDKPDTIAMPLGQPDRFGGVDNNRRVGLAPEGWRGLNGRYAELNLDGTPSALGTLVTENLICVDALLELPLDEVDSEKKLLDREAAMNTLTATPHVATLENKKGIRDYGFPEVAQFVSETLPSYVTLGDPVIYLYANETCRRPYEITVRPGSLYEMQPEDPRAYEKAA